MDKKITLDGMTHVYTRTSINERVYEPALGRFATPAELFYKSQDLIRQRSAASLLKNKLSNDALVDIETRKKQKIKQQKDYKDFWSWSDDDFLPPVSLNSVKNQMDTFANMYLMSPDKEVTGSVTSVKIDKNGNFIGTMKLDPKKILPYDPSACYCVECKNDRNELTDMWDTNCHRTPARPKRESRGSNVTALPGGESLGELKDLELFTQRLIANSELPKYEVVDYLSLMSADHTPPDKEIITALQKLSTKVKLDYQERLELQNAKY